MQAMSSIKGLKEYVEKLETSINATLNLVQEKIASLETLNATLSGETEKFSKLYEIISKVEAGNEIGTASKLIADELKDDILQIRNVMIENLVEENKKLWLKVSHLEAKVIGNERYMHKMDQHSRKVNMEIEGIPESVDQSSLKKTAVDIFHHAGIAPVTEADIEVIHRLKSKRSPPTTILKAKRDFLEKVFAQRKSIVTVGTKLGFGQDVKLYVNCNLCPAYSNLAYNCRLLRKEGLIKNTWSTNGTVKIETVEGGIKVITHEADLVKRFTDFGGFSFDTTPYMATDETISFTELGH